VFPCDSVRHECADWPGFPGPDHADRGWATRLLARCCGAGAPSGENCQKVGEIHDAVARGVAGLRGNLNFVGAHVDVRRYARSVGRAG